MNALLLLTKPAILTHRRPVDTALRRQRGSIYGLTRVDGRYPVPFPAATLLLAL